MLLVEQRAARAAHEGVLTCNTAPIYHIGHYVKHEMIITYIAFMIKSLHIKHT